MVVQSPPPGAGIWGPAYLRVKNKTRCRRVCAIGSPSVRRLCAAHTACVMEVSEKDQREYTSLLTAYPRCQGRGKTDRVVCPGLKSSVAPHYLQDEESRSVTAGGDRAPHTHRHTEPIPSSWELGSLAGQMVVRTRRKYTSPAQRCEDRTKVTHNPGIKPWEHFVGFLANGSSPYLFRLGGHQAGEGWRGIWGKGKHVLHKVGIPRAWRF